MRGAGVRAQRVKRGLPWGYGLAHSLGSSSQLVNLLPSQTWPSLWRGPPGTSARPLQVRSALSRELPVLGRESPHLGARGAPVGCSAQGWTVLWGVEGEPRGAGTPPKRGRRRALPCHFQLLRGTPQEKTGTVGPRLREQWE